MFGLELACKLAGDFAENWIKWPLFLQSLPGEGLHQFQTSRALRLKVILLSCFEDWHGGCAFGSGQI